MTKLCSCSNIALCFHGERPIIKLKFKKAANLDVLNYKLGPAKPTLRGLYFMSDKINRMITAIKYPQYKDLYQGNLDDDLIHELENHSTITQKLEDYEYYKTDIRAVLPEEDELVEITDHLRDALDMKKSDMQEQIKKVLQMLENKNMEMFNRSECARDLLK